MLVISEGATALTLLFAISDTLFLGVYCIFVRERIIYSCCTSTVLITLKELNVSQHILRAFSLLFAFFFIFYYTAVELYAHKRERASEREKERERKVCFKMSIASSLSS